MNQWTFLGIPEKEEADIVFISAPYDATTSYKPGTREGPRRIIEASRYLEFYDEETRYELYKKKNFLTLGEPELPIEPEKALSLLKDIIRPYIEGDLFPVMMGGEHTVTLALFDLLKEKYSDICVLQIDAHLDMRMEYQGTPLSHACVMRRIYEKGVEVFPLGIRAVSKEEAEFVERERIKVYYAREVLKNPQALALELIEKIGSRPLYITLDLDGMDPSEVPGVGTPEPGGLHWYELLDLLRPIAQKNQIVGFDVVELRPLPEDHRSEFWAARFIYKFLSYIYQKYATNY